LSVVLAVIDGNPETVVFRLEVVVGDVVGSFPGKVVVFVDGVGLGLLTFVLEVGDELVVWLEGKLPLL
jgi:hypothetical protein